MSSRLTLLFVCDQPELYPAFISAFDSQEFEIVIARNPARAKVTLVSRNIDAVVIRHDRHRDDRGLARRLRSAAPQTPVFLLTDQPQPAGQPDVDAVWRAETADEPVSRAMAVLLRQFLKLSRGARASKLVPERTNPLFPRLRPEGLG